MTKTKIALVAAALCSGAVFGQDVPTSTNSATVTGVATSHLALDVAPEIRAQLLEAAAAEIGPVPQNDLDDLIARHAAEKAKFLAIAERKVKAAAAKPRPAAVEASPAKTVVVVPAGKSQPPPSAVAALDAAIAELGTVRARLAEEALKNGAK